MREMIDATWVIERYLAVQERLPAPQAPGQAHSEPSRISDLGAVMDGFDTFVFDSFGVLNVGETSIPGAVKRIAQLRDAGKQLFILTNAASTPLNSLEAKYDRLGFDFSAQEIISSRAVLMASLQAFDKGMKWSVIASADAGIEELPARVSQFSDMIDLESDGFIFLSSHGWTPDRHQLLLDALASKPRPLLIGNPDIVAPREVGLSMEPGAYAHDLADKLDMSPEFYGKPFGNAFDFLFARAKGQIVPERTIMLGDTLHTDIVGAAAVGLKTGLVTEYGILRDMDLNACMERSGIYPDFIMPAI